MRVGSHYIWRVVGFGGLALAIACGGGGSSNSGGGTTPTPTPTPGTGGSTGTTITITSTGVSPKTLTVSAGTQVTFVNSDTRNHTMNSNPHPDHTDCEPINAVGFLTPGQSRQTGNLNTVRTCGYHDHELFPQPQWEGTITVQ